MRIENHNTGEVLLAEGDCNKHYSPASTVKPAIALMGYDQKILTDKNQPLVKFELSYLDWLGSASKEGQDMLWPLHGQVICS